MIIGGENSTLWGGKGNDTLTGGDGENTYIFSAGKDVITNYAEGDKISLGASITSVSVKSSDVIFKVGSNTLTVKNSAGKKITVNDEVYIYESGVITVDGSAVTSALNITGNTSANVIYGGAGEDTLFGGTGNDSLTGGDDADLYIFKAGKDVITDYAEEDKISIGASISNVSVKSSDVIFKVGSNTLTVKSSAGKKITVNDEVYIYESGVITVDGSAVTSALNITGNNSANVIYGGTKNDSLNGGAGNDSLTGGKGNDTFIASAGNDTITDYKAGKDKIKIAASITGTEIDGKNIIFTTSEGSITVIDGVGQKITTLDSKNKSATETYSASSARTLVLFDDNNFLTDSAQLSDITEQKFTVTEIQTDNKDELYKTQEFLTYSNEK